MERKGKRREKKKANESFATDANIELSCWTVESGTFERLLPGRRSSWHHHRRNGHHRAGGSRGRAGGPGAPVAGLEVAVTRAETAEAVVTRSGKYAKE